MNSFFTLLGREIVLSWRIGGATLSAALFMLALTLLMPLAIGPDLALLRRLAAPIIWIGALLSCLLTLDRLFQADEEDGTLDLLLLAPCPVEILALSKITAHWLMTGLPLVFLSPIYGTMLGLDAAALPALALSLLIGTPALSALGAFGAALTLNLKRGALLLPLLVLPLAVPLLIFGTLCAAPADLTVMTQKPLMIFAGLSLLCLALSPLGIALALKAGRA